MLVHELGETTASVGRAPDNQLPLADPIVSGHHATFWIEAGSVWVRDLNSRNGTFVSGRRVQGAVTLQDGDEVTLGTETRIRVRVPVGLTGERKTMMLEDLTTGLRHHLVSSRFHIGSADMSDLYIEGAESREATLIVHPDGEIWLGSEDGEERMLETDQPFEVAGHKLQIRQGDALWAPTVEVSAEPYPYRLTATLDGAAGPEAVLEHKQTRSRYRVDAENRAVLLYLLGRQVIEDRGGPLAPGAQGWCSDDDVGTGIWGRGGSGDANSLHVLVYRLRKELTKAGFDPWFIEKRRRAIRIRLRDVDIQ